MSGHGMRCLIAATPKNEAATRAYFTLHLSNYHAAEIQTVQDISDCGRFGIELAEITIGDRLNTNEEKSAHPHILISETHRIVKQTELVLSFRPESATLTTAWARRLRAWYLPTNPRAAVSYCGNYNKKNPPDMADRGTASAIWLIALPLSAKNFRRTGPTWSRIGR